MRSPLRSAGQGPAAQVPHAGVPNQLVLVRLNFSMFDFYSDAWSFAFAALLPLLVVLGTE